MKINRWMIFGMGVVFIIVLLLSFKVMFDIAKVQENEHRQTNDVEIELYIDNHPHVDENLDSGIDQ